ncbi:MAG: Efflux transporter, RND family, MFP subunit [Parcubacteria group bacterium GW2011_GWA2_47_12]|nr:MAG: Efflux transporter, RND family, MFP subunit [Parcubacteria group bacterium GW2011_GWA2_47_12]
MIKKNILIIVFSVAVLAAASYFYFENSKDSTDNVFVVAGRKNIVQAVSVTGRVNPASNIELAFEKSGKIKRIYVEVGSQVYAGQIMIELENGDAAANLAAAKAAQKAAEAKLSELKTGARAEELAISETKVKNAENALEDAKKNLVDKIFDAYTKSDDAVRNKADQLFSNPKSVNPQLNFSVSDFSLENDIESGRYLAEKNLIGWQKSLTALNTGGDLNAYVAEAGSSLEKIKNLLEKISIAVNSLTAGASFSQTTLDGWKADISAARTNVNTAVGNISSANEKMRGSASALNLAEDELALTKAGSTPEAISSQEAAVEKSSADVAAGVSVLEKTILRSPVSGTVSKIDADAGEIVQPSSTIAGVISNTAFKIEADVPEADIAKIKIGDEAKVTLDAYGPNAFFDAKVVSIEPAERMIDGVATYRTTFQFNKDDERIRSGMTANIDVTTAKRDNSLVIPARTIYTKDGKKYINIYLDKNKSEERQIEIGIQSSDGNVEIISGINEGEKILTSR